MNHGRKSWNNKIVESVMKLLIKEELNNRNQQKRNNGQKDVVPPILQEIVTLKESTVDDEVELTRQFEGLKNSRLKYVPIQTAIMDHMKKSKDHLDHIQSDVMYIIETLKNNYILSAEKTLQLVQLTITEGLNKLTQNIKSNKIIIQNEEEKMTEENPKIITEKRNLVLIPKDKKSLKDITSIFREEARAMEEFPELPNIKTTLNNNLIMTASANKIQKIIEILKKSDKLQQITTVIHIGK